MIQPPFPNSYWLEHGRILCGEYPRDFDDFGDHKSMSAILGAGARVFIDLTEERELKPYKDIALGTAKKLGISPDSLEFHRFPIRDVSIPRSREEMNDIIRCIRKARLQHKTVYLHCRGGRGRTGTVAGCVLVSLFGFAGPAALAILADCREACARARYDDSPETGEQRAFVSSSPSVLASPPTRFRGAIYGAAVGDALGVPVEFQARSTRRHDPVTSMRELGSHNQPAGTWSDDTSMILATMAALASSAEYSPGAIMEEFSHWMVKREYTPHGEVFDIGNATCEAISRYLVGIPPTECGGTDEWSNGNGSLMRILPIALAYAQRQDLITRASEISSLTHSHERSRLCCAFYSLVISELLHGSSIREATLFAWSVLDETWEFSCRERARFEKLHPDQLFCRTEDQIASSGHVTDTLEAALWVNAAHENFADIVLHAINLGDDTDTTGCVAGALAGIRYGHESIPGEWLSLLAGSERIESITEAFLKYASLEGIKLIESNFCPWTWSFSIYTPPNVPPPPGLPEFLPVPRRGNFNPSLEAACLADRLLRRGFPVRLEERGLVLCLGNTNADVEQLVDYLRPLASDTPKEGLSIWSKDKKLITIDVEGFSKNTELQQSLLSPDPCRFETAMVHPRLKNPDPWKEFLSNKFGAKVNVEDLELGIALLVKVLPWIGVRTVMSCHGHSKREPLRIWFSDDHHSRWCKMVFDRLCPDLPIHTRWRINRSSPIDSAGYPVMWKLRNGDGPCSEEGQYFFDQIQLIARRLFDPDLCQRIRDVRRHGKRLEDLPPLLDSVFKDRSP
jgi:ADP-ribosylglycohydrolase